MRRTWATGGPQSREGLPGAFASRIRTGPLSAGDGVVVAVSGGLDSTVLLHLLRFTTGLPDLSLHVAHYDHRMRPRSGSDADWVRGLAAAWELPVTVGRPDDPPAGEADARSSRYAYLEAVRARVGARWVLTAHHADDQAETVLFRVLRGSGPRGLAGIPERREPGIYRPLLPFWREEIEAYGERVGLVPRVDPTNVDLRFARNVLRHRVLPMVEEAVAPGARGALVRLAERSREDEEAWDVVIEDLTRGIVVERTEGGIAFARDRFLVYPPGVRSRVLRHLAGRLGVRLGHAGTRTALEFTRACASGRSIPLPGGASLSRSFDRLILSVGTPAGKGSRAVAIPGPGRGGGEGVAGGAAFLVRWSTGSSPDTGAESFDRDGLRFPLEVREWRPGDRIRLTYGSKKLKKLFAEARIPRDRRARVPVVVDAVGEVLWIPGVARSVLAPVGTGEGILNIGVETDADDAF